MMEPDGPRLGEIPGLRGIGEELKVLIGRVPGRDSDVAAAHRSLLGDPFDLPGLPELLAEIDKNRTLRIVYGGDPESLAAAAAFRFLFHRGPRLQAEELPEEQPPAAASAATLDFRRPRKLFLVRPRRSGEVISLSLDSPDPDQPLNRSGLVFKLGQAQQLFREKDFNWPYVVFDLETTALEPPRGEIIEIGAWKVLNGRVGERFHSLVKADRPIPPEVVAITGITERDLLPAPALAEVLPRFLDFIGDATLVAHNVRFDFTFLRHYARRILNIRLTNPTIDTLGIARARLPGIKHNLKSLAEHLNIELTGWHRALGDARATADIFIRFQEENTAKTRYRFFKKAIVGAALGILLDPVPARGENAVFLRWGLPEVAAAFKAGEARDRRRRSPGPSRREIFDNLSSRRKARRQVAIYHLLKKASGVPGPPAGG